MSTFTQILYHIVFSTKNRKPSLSKGKEEKLYCYIWGIIKNKNCHLYRIGGMKDHIHILSSLKPNMNLSNFIKDIKVSSTIWIKEHKYFPVFDGWQKGYAAFTCSFKDKNKIINYIINQTEHHKKKSFKEELKDLLIEFGVEFNEKYLV